MAISPDPLILAREIGFEPDIAEFVTSHTRSRLEKLRNPTAGLSIAVADGDEAERTMKEIQLHLVSRGYRAFWSQRYEPNGMRETDEVVVLRTVDPDAIVRICGTDGANYDISNEDILDRLVAWRHTCSFDVVGASRDWVALQFGRLPHDVCAFASEIYQFCPDTVGQGVGLARESDDPEKFRAARLLCPHVSAPSQESEEATFLDSLSKVPPEFAEQMKGMYQGLAKHSTPTDMGVRLLAHELVRSKYVFLWWD